MNLLEQDIARGELIAKSGLAGCSNVEQGALMAWHCRVTGTSPIDLINGVHFIGGKLSISANEMLARFRTQGGDHHFDEISSERVSIVLSLDGKSFTYSVTWEDMQEEDTPWKDKAKGILKSNWQGKVSRQQMLLARACSNAVRAFAPEVLQAARYTPEEWMDVEVEPARTAAVTLSSVGAREVEVMTQVPQPDPAPAPAQDEPEEHAALEPTRAQFIRDLFDILGLDGDQQREWLSQYKAGAVAGLTTFQADHLIAQLREQLEGHQQSSFEPADPADIDRIKALIREIKAVAGFEGIVDEVKSKLAKLGDGVRLDDLNRAQAKELTNHLEARDVEKFFALDLMSKNGDALSAAQQ